MSTAVTQTKESLPKIAGPRLPYHPLVAERFGVERDSWKALVEAIFPNAVASESVILALSYCKARNLDPFKRNVHIVPIWNKDMGCMVDTIWPGIGELRTTAFRTGEYTGRGQTVFGPDITKKVGTLEITFPEWAQVSVFRTVRGERVEFSGPRVYWLETYATTKRNDDTPNEMWSNRPRGQIEKCAEAAALRAAFPEEIGCEYTNDEVEHKSQGPAITVPSRRPATLDALIAPLKQPEPQEEREPEYEPTAEGEYTEAYQGEPEPPQPQSDPMNSVFAWEMRVNEASGIAELDNLHAKLTAALGRNEVNASDAGKIAEMIAEKRKAGVKRK